MTDYRPHFSDVALSLAPSGIREFFDIAVKVKDCISLGVGEPDFVTPWAIRQAGIESLEKGRTWYTSNSGLAELRQAICDYLDRRFAQRYDPETETLVTVGGSEAIDICCRAFLNPGDEVILPEPSFVAYRAMASLCGAKVVAVETKAENHFRLTADELRAAITDKTKLLIFPFPNNPTGAVMRKEHLAEIAEVLKDTNIFVLSDEIYAELTYGDERHVSISTLSEDMRRRTVLVSGFSKAFAMTGWRLGYACAPAPIMEQMLKIHQYAIMCSPTVAQYAGIAAMRDCDEAVREMVDEYAMRRRFLIDSFNRLGLTCFEPLGAFYVFPSVAIAGMSSKDFCKALLESEKVALVPGDAFGASGEGFVRVSYSYSVAHLTEALARIERFLKKRGLL